MLIRRLPDNPIITPETPGADERMGTNINGPSLIRVPDWVTDPLGRYYLYFAHHGGSYIRLAYADRVEGPWRIHPPGTLQLSDTPCGDHIASPDVHVDHERRQIRMYYHGPTPSVTPGEPPVHDLPFRSNQCTHIATSSDGVHFEHVGGPIAPSYLRAWRWRDAWYGLAMPGIFSRSPDGLDDWQRGPTRFDHQFRHGAVRRRDDVLEIYFTRAGDAPERILRSTMTLTDDWADWQPAAPTVVLEPAMDWEGVHAPLAPSRRGPVDEPARQLRDPCIYEEAGRTWLLYAVAGECGLAVAEIIDD